MKTQPAFNSSSYSEASPAHKCKAKQHTHFSERKNYRMEFLISANNLILNNWLISSETKQQREIAFEVCFSSQNFLNCAVQEPQKNMPEHNNEHVFEFLTRYSFVKNAEDFFSFPVCPPLKFNPSLLPQKFLKVFKDLFPLIEKQVWRTSCWKLWLAPCLKNGKKILNQIKK